MLTHIARRAAGRRRICALLLSLLIAAAAGPLSPALAAPPPPPSVVTPKPLTAAQWREDLHFLAAELERRHKNLFHAVSRDRFAAAVANLDRRIPQMSRDEIVVGMMRIVAMVGDGHTRIDLLDNPNAAMAELPIRLYLFEDGLYVRAAAPEYAALAGARVDAIGGVPTAEALKRVDPIVASDNAFGVKFHQPLYLAMPGVLHALKLSQDAASATYTLTKDGRTFTAVVRGGAPITDWPDDTDGSFITPPGWTDARTTPQPPAWLADPLTFHRLIEMPEQKAIYAQLNEVTNVKGESLGQFGKRIRERAEATGARAIVLDLRLNYGGNGDLRSPFVRELIKAEDDDTRLYVLTWRGGFSATQFILDDLDRLTDAVFIGEPAGSRPNSYGDGYTIALPDSAISAKASIWWWQAGQADDPFTPIDVATPLTFADYAAGRDPALDAALSYTPGLTLYDRLLQAATAGGPDATRQALAAYQADPKNRYQNLALTVPRAADRLYGAGHHEDAYAVAQAAAATYPASVDAAIVHAYLADLTGRKDVALKEARRTLTLDPNNRSARNLMEKLGGQGS